MAECSITALIHPWRCLLWAREHPIKWALAIAMGSVVGLLLAAAIYVYAQATAPQYPVLVGPVKVWRGDAGTVWLLAHYESAMPLRCLRQDTTIMVDYSTDPRPTYFQAGASMGGRGLKGSRYSYDVLRALPADFPLGEWQFMTRFHYECEPWGLVHWETTLGPVLINIPPMASAQP